MGRRARLAQSRHYVFTKNLILHYVFTKCLIFMKSFPANFSANLPFSNRSMVGTYPVENSGRANLSKSPIANAALPSNSSVETVQEAAAGHG